MSLHLGTFYTILTEWLMRSSKSKASKISKPIGLFYQFLRGICNCIKSTRGKKLTTFGPFFSWSIVYFHQKITTIRVYLTVSHWTSHQTQTGNLIIWKMFFFGKGNKPGTNDNTWSAWRNTQNVI